jgi:Tfp pilus assembly protein PilN
MTTTVLPDQPTAPAGDPLRVVPIAANLLPSEITDARRGRRARRMVITALVVLTVAIAGWYVVTKQQTEAARADLATAEDEALRLTTRQREFADVVKVQSESEAISSELSKLLADDLQWAQLLGSLRAAAPRGVGLTAVSGALAERTEDGRAASPGIAQLPSSSSAKSIGTVTITGVGESKSLIAAYVDRLGSVKGVADPYLGGATEQDGSVQFTVRLSLTEAALGGRHTPKTNEQNPNTTGGN